MRGENNASSRNNKTPTIHTIPIFPIHYRYKPGWLPRTALATRLLHPTPALRPILPVLPIRFLLPPGSILTPPRCRGRHIPLRCLPRSGRSAENSGLGAQPPLLCPRSGLPCERNHSRQRQRQQSRRKKQRYRHTYADVW